ncbi:hypothetical protein CUMW_238300, partial [Citrus unshiu]
LSVFNILETRMSFVNLPDRDSLLVYSLFPSQFPRMQNIITRSSMCTLLQDEWIDGDIYVPINCDGYWYMLLVDISHGTTSIWDSLESPSLREKMVNESLAIVCS